MKYYSHWYWDYLTSCSTFPWCSLIQLCIGKCPTWNNCHNMHFGKCCNMFSMIVISFKSFHKVLKFCPIWHKITFELPWFQLSSLYIEVVKGGCIFSWHFALIPLSIGRWISLDHCSTLTKRVISPEANLIQGAVLHLLHKEISFLLEQAFALDRSGLFSAPQNVVGRAVHRC